MKIGIVTLVGDNYGNKYQNYAVEQILRTYGDVETFRVISGSPVTNINQVSMLKKIRPSYIKEVIRCRLMGRYDLANTERSIIGSLLYAMIYRKKILNAKRKRQQKFADFNKKYLHISERSINYENCRDTKWIGQYDYFVCGSDQIWNPTYASTTELAFLSFAKGKSIALAPSFGLSFIPDDAKEKYKKWINDIDILSVREESGREIIKELTGRDAEVLLDPTMALSVDVWKNMAERPKSKLPEHYVVCYFLGRVDKHYKNAIKKFAIDKQMPVITLFDIENPEYYTLGPAEVLYSILHADYVLTDSFHGTVFSILFQKSFWVFERNEGALSMSTRINTLLDKFQLGNRRYGMTDMGISQKEWNFTIKVLKEERKRTMDYIEKAVR